MAIDPDPSGLKIFPRNLTARAEHVVRGNPPTTRPESGVDNCYPGLEFDQRNLDKQFFPGLVFEFHHGDGARLHAFSPGPAPPEPWVREGDPPLWLWALAGRTRVEQDEPDVIFFNGLSGLEVWRRVHDLLPGRVAIIVGAAPGRSSEPVPVAVRALIDAADGARGRELRFADGRLYAIVLAGERAPYLDEGGVIDLDAYEPGELTRSLCAPWQYDFRDCGCFYWAASKPDLVTSADGAQPYLNFQRRDRSATAPADVPPFDDRTAQELSYAELVAGAWNELPVVLNDRESMEFSPPGPAPMDRLWTRDEVVQELRYLATVEHALSVEYLYSHYSLRAPMQQPAPDADPVTREIFAAAYEVFLVAVDEMRHLRWANEALSLLGQGPSIGRAERLGRELDHPFELRPLTPEQLQWYIDVEAPSQAIGEGIDGMYVRLHVSIDRQPDLFPERPRLVPLIKLIIDEGEAHYERFRAVQRHLSDLQPSQYLRALGVPSPGSQEAVLADHADASYGLLLGTLSVVFALGDTGAGTLIEQARRLMFNLHETCHRLAHRGVAPRFTLPPGLPAPLPVPDERRMIEVATSSRAALAELVDALATSTDATLRAVATDDDADVRAMAGRHLAVRDAVLASLRAAIAAGSQ
jgi:Ferritin-like